MTRSARARRFLGTPLCAVVVIALPTTGPLPAQEPSVRVHLEPAVAMVGEQIRLTIEVLGASEVEDPPDVRRHSLFRFIDRRPDRALPFATEITAPPTGQVGGTVTFAYSLVANTAGSFEVGPFEVTADGRKLRTEPVTLLVTFPDPGAISVRARFDRTEVEVMEEFELIVDVTPANVVLARPYLPDVTGVAARGGWSRSDGSIAFDLIATAPGTHEIGPIEFKVGDETLKTEPVTLVAVGDPPPIEAQAFLNTGQTWVGSDFVLVVEVGAREMDADPVLPDMSAFAEPPLATGSGSSSGGDWYTVSREYQVRAVAAGEFEIGPVQVTVAGQTVLTEPLRLVISDAPPPAPFASPKDLLATATADRHRVYVGEPVIVTYRVLARDNRTGGEGWSVEEDDTLVLPPHDNFQHQRLRSRGDWWERVSVDGRLYRVAAEHRVVFSPTEAGETAIKPAEFMVQVNQRGRVDAFEMNEAEREGTWTPMIIATEPVPIEVVPLPAEGRPGSFRGHVGRLEMASWIDRTDMEIGDTVTLRVEVSGLSPVAPDPEFVFPAGFEVSEPEIGPVDRGDVSDLRETRRYVYRLVANREGSYRIPLVEVSWFDPETRSYGTSGTEPFDVTVGGG